MEVRYLVGERVTGKDLQARITDVRSDVATAQADILSVKAKTDNLPANTASSLTTLSTDVGAVKTVVDAVKAKTDNLPSDPADQSAVEAAITSAHSTTDTLITTVDTVVDAIKLKTDNLPADPADQSAVEAAITSAHGVTNGKVDTVQADVTSIKAKTDNLPANTSTTLSALSTDIGTANTALTAIKGSGFAASDSLKDIKAAVMAVQNNTTFTASVIPQMIVPASGNADFHNLVNVYDGTGGMEDPDLELVFVRYEVSHGASRNSNIFDNTARSSAATKIVAYTVTAPTTAPTAGAVYHDSASTSFTVIGMAGTDKLIASWTGGTAPVVGTGTLTKDSGTGDSTITALSVENNYVAMVNDPGVGQYSSFYNVQSTDAEENLSARFMYYTSGVQHVFDRATVTVSPTNAATTASAVWDVTAGSHVTAGTTGKVVSDTLTAVNAIKTVTDALPNAGALTSLAQDSTVAKASNLATAQSDITAIKTVTDNLPNAGALTSLATASAVSTIDTKVDAIKAKTDNLPANTATSLSTLSSDVASVKSDTTAIKTKTDNLPANTTNRLDTIDSAIAAIKTLPSRVQASKTCSSIAQGASTTLDIDAAAGFNCQVAQLFDLEVTRVSGASSDWSFDICEKSDASFIRASVANMTPSDPSLMNLGGQIFVNQDTSPGKHLYVRITNNTDAGSSTFNVKLRGVVFQDAAA
jgi:uncharacterized protein YoxC